MKDEYVENIYSGDGLFMFIFSMLLAISIAAFWITEFIYFKNISEKNIEEIQIDNEDNNSKSKKKNLRKLDDFEVHSDDYIF